MCKGKIEPTKESVMATLFELSAVCNREGIDLKSLEIDEESFKLIEAHKEISLGYLNTQYGQMKVAKEA